MYLHYEYKTDSASALLGSQKSYSAALSRGRNRAIPVNKKAHCFRGWAVQSVLSKGQNRMQHGYADRVSESTVTSHPECQK